MSGWITYPAGKELERRLPVILIPALQAKWMLLANDLRDNHRAILEKNASIGFYCGLLSGQTAADSPSLTADLPEYYMLPYEALFFPTQAALDVSVHLSVENSGEPGVYRILRTRTGDSFMIRGSLPPLPPFATVRECRYFGFSPYILKEK